MLRTYQSLFTAISVVKKYKPCCCIKFDVSEHGIFANGGMGLNSILLAGSL